MAAIRLQPGFATRAYEPNGPHAWAMVDAKIGVASITTIVRLNGAPAGQYHMLTAGHAFRDADTNKANPVGVQNNFIGEPAASRAPNQQLVKWGEDRLRGVPYATSTGQYHCAGDKLGSQLDAGIALLDAGLLPGTAFNQTYSGGLTLVGIDAQWPPRALLPNEEYRLGPEVKHPTVVAGLFHTNWNNWNKTGFGDLTHVMTCPDIRPVVGGAGPVGTTGGISGKALIRTVPAAHGAAPTQAFIIGVFLGVSKNRMDAASPDYEIYQHISQAVAQFNIADLA